MRCPHCNTEIQYGVKKCRHCTGDIQYSSLASQGTLWSIAKYTAGGGAILLPMVLGYFGFVDSLKGYLISAGIGAVLGMSLPFYTPPSRG